MLEQPQTGLISRFYRQVENRLKNLESENFQADSRYDGTKLKSPVSQSNSYDDAI